MSASLAVPDADMHQKDARPARTRTSSHVPDGLQHQKLIDALAHIGSCVLWTSIFAKVPRNSCDMAVLGILRSVLFDTGQAGFTLLEPGGLSISCSCSAVDACWELELGR